MKRILTLFIASLLLSSVGSSNAYAVEVDNVSALSKLEQRKIKLIARKAAAAERRAAAIERRAAIIAKRAAKKLAKVRPITVPKPNLKDLKPVDIAIGVNPKPQLGVVRTAIEIKALARKDALLARKKAAVERRAVALAKREAKKAKNQFKRSPIDVIANTNPQLGKAISPKELQALKRKEAVLARKVAIEARNSERKKLKVAADLAKKEHRIKLVNDRKVANERIVAERNYSKEFVQADIDDVKKVTSEEKKHHKDLYNAGNISQKGLIQNAAKTTKRTKANVDRAINRLNNYAERVISESKADLKKDHEDFKATSKSKRVAYIVERSKNKIKRDTEHLIENQAKAYENASRFFKKGNTIIASQRYDDIKNVKKKVKVINKALKEKLARPKERIDKFNKRAEKKINNDVKAVGKAVQKHLAENRAKEARLRKAVQLEARKKALEARKLAKKAHLLARTEVNKKVDEARSMELNARNLARDAARKKVSIARDAAVKARNIAIAKHKKAEDVRKKVAELKKQELVKARNIAKAEHQKAVEAHAKVAANLKSAAIKKAEIAKKAHNSIVKAHKRVANKVVNAHKKVIKKLKFW